MKNRDLPPGEYNAFTLRFKSTEVEHEYTNTKKEYINSWQFKVGGLVMVILLGSVILVFLLVSPTYSDLYFESLVTLVLLTIALTLEGALFIWMPTLCLRGTFINAVIIAYALLSSKAAIMYASLDIC
jgi:hypothetical protein